MAFYKTSTYAILLLFVCNSIVVINFVEKNFNILNNGNDHYDNIPGNLDTNDSLGWSKLSEVGDFNDQMEYLMDRVRMKRSTAHGLQILLKTLEQELSQLWPDMTITRFGSVINGLALDTSDIDAFITLPSLSDDKLDASNTVIAAANFLKNSTNFKIHTLLPYIQVPLLTLVYIPTSQKCDVTFKKYDPTHDSKLFRYLFQSNYKGLSLMVFFKYWARVLNLTQSHTRRLKNILWYYLVTFYLQQVNIFPPVHVLQASATPFIRGNWNFAFDEEFEYLYPPKNNKTLHELLGDFFTYYANFDYDISCVSIYAGRPIRRNCFDNVNCLPDLFKMYKTNVINGIHRIGTNEVLCVQRSFAHNEIVSIGVKQHHLDMVKTYFVEASNIFKSHDKKQVLSALLTMKVS